MKVLTKVPIPINCSSTNSQNNRNRCTSSKPNEAFKNRILETRKGELNSIYKTMDELSKKEIDRIKVLFNEHLDYFKEKKVPVIVEGELEEDLNDRYFEEK